MSNTENMLATGTYIGQTADILARRTGADKLAGGVSQKALFQRRGEIALHPDRLVLGDWGDAGDLVLRPGDIKTVRVEFTELYGRFIGGLLNAGKPLILELADDEIYLLIDRKEFMETTDDRRWGELIEKWIAA
ncbi:hypothetical protein [Allokutzneria oryzae]|uniref:Uncharacterized protein n=1 Tax=Allokutzneria oryzae TaxID=1378989 RepID=A0ABV5ZTQ2_9PSEU